MCGIFAYTGRQTDAAPRVLEGLKRLEYRGYDSWGVAVRSDSSIAVQKQVGKIGDARVALPPSAVGFGHTRWATHGGVTEANAHPHISQERGLALVHNGIIENHQTLRRDVLAAGGRIQSETDTEVALHLIADALPRHERSAAALADAVREVFARLEGMNALIALEAGSAALVAVKNGSPLCIGYGEDGNYIASDAAALLPHTRRVTFLGDGQLVIVGPDRVTIHDAATGELLAADIVELDWKVEQAELGQHQHYLSKEIDEQAELIRMTALTQTETAQQLANMIRSSSASFLIGCGTAANAALTGQYLFSRVAGRHVAVGVGSEFDCLEHLLTSKSLVIALSQSGETIDVLEPLIRAKKQKNVRIAALVNVLGSTLYRMADFNALLKAGPEKCVLATKSYTAKLAVLTLTAYALAGRLEQGRQLLLRAADLVEEQLSQASRARIAELAERIYRCEHMFLIGRCLSYASSLEAALKIKEVSYIHAEGFAAGELKHGVIALIEPGTPCVVFAPNDETQRGIFSSAEELRARGGYIIGVSPTPSDVFDFHIPVGDAGDAAPIVQAAPIQLLAYYLALKRGADPDKPRNLAKSVTVK
jgi:glucosamine--fructose-6-phosphate aminotransferase (isomerizing)